MLKDTGKDVGDTEQNKIIPNIHCLSLFSCPFCSHKVYKWGWAHHAVIVLHTVSSDYSRIMQI